MWIRSQDRRKLINVDNFYIGHNCGHKTIVGNDYELGYYDTEEKALKVLDMIQACISKDFSKLPTFNYMDKIKLIHEIANWGTQDCMNILKDNFVFQMPQDSEVK